jgi:hypothetical protein
MVRFELFDKLALKTANVLIKNGVDFAVYFRAIDSMLRYGTVR